MCRRAFARLLGVGCGRLQRARKNFNGLDERTLKSRGPATFTFTDSSAGNGGRPAVATASINTFMRKVYYSISESMPTSFLGLIRVNCFGQIIEVDFCFADGFRGGTG